MVCRSIVLFSNSYTMGGMEKHLVQLAAGLVQRRFRVGAICSPSDGIAPLRHQLVQAGVEVHVPADRTASGLDSPRRLRDLVRVLRAYPECILHLHFSGHSGGDILVLAAQLSSVRAIVRTDHNPPDPPTSTHARITTRLRDRFLARIICVSEQSRYLHINLL